MEHKTMSTGSSVFYCSPHNSTFFTDCCQVAICDDQQKCPICKKDVFPFYEGMTDEDRNELAGGYHHRNTRVARARKASHGHY